MCIPDVLQTAKLVLVLIKKTNLSKNFKKKEENETKHCFQVQFYAKNGLEQFLEKTWM